MKTVYKYTNIINSDVLTFYLPRGAKILKVDTQQKYFDYRTDPICLWALVDTDVLNFTESRYILIVGTGHQIPLELEDKLKYINTFVVNEALWFHAFEITE